LAQFDKCINTHSGSEATHQHTAFTTHCVTTRSCVGFRLFFYRQLQVKRIEQRQQLPEADAFGLQFKGGHAALAEPDARSQFTLIELTGFADCLNDSYPLQGRDQEGCHDVYSFSE
jgi:hypothetical protein